MAKEQYSTELASSAYINIGEDMVEAGLILEDGSVLKTKMSQNSTEAKAEKGKHSIQLRRDDEGAVIRSYSYFGMKLFVERFTKVTNGDYWLGGETI